MRQSINQSIDRSINQSIHPSINYSIDQSINRSIDQSINDTIDQSINQNKARCVSKAIVASLTDRVCQAFSCGAGEREEALKTSAREAAAKPVM